MDAPPLQKSVLETILDWSASRPMWQRDALRRIVAEGKLTDAVLKELIEICKAEKMGVSGKLVPVPLGKEHLPANPGADSAITIRMISEVSGVNNLAPNESLDFRENGVSIVYGDNATGKSGYSRILKRACRARHAGKIEANIYASPASRMASATIAYSAGGKPESPENWIDSGKPHPKLSAASVFDKDCATVHIAQTNEVAFRPFGLDIPDELAGACQKIKELLTKELDAFDKVRDSIFVKPPWKPTTKAGTLLNTVRHDTEIPSLKAMGTLSEEEKNRLSRLREDLAKDLSKSATEQLLKADQLKKLLDSVEKIESVTADEVVTIAQEKIVEAEAAKTAARLARENAFSGEQMKGIGGAVWNALWQAARRYSTEIAYPRKQFPPENDELLCVLCQQPIKGEAVTRLQRFEDFIKADTELYARETEQAARNAQEGLSTIIISTRTLEIGLRELQLQDARLEKKTRRFLASARLRRKIAIRNLGGEGFPVPITSDSPVAEIKTIESQGRKYAGELKAAATATERKKLEEELAELQDRQILGDNIEVVESEVKRLQDIEFVNKCLADTATNAITNLGNDIADRVITPKLRDRFHKEIVKLAAEKVRVEIVRVGGKYGSPQYQVRFLAKPDAKVRDILSEGEQTCVALAAFLTELETASHASALIFDDPVSSLDHKWRKKVAERLVEESQTRQVIVFTHDLVFVNDLREAAEERTVEVHLRTLTRISTGTGSVGEGLPWIGTKVEERLYKLEKQARAAKDLYDKDEEEKYKKEAIAVYTGLRSTWERTVQEVIFNRVVLRHRDYIEAKKLKKVTALSTTDCDSFEIGYKKCCGLIESHDPSEGRNAGVPSPADLLKDINALKDWISALRAKQKLIPD